MAKPRKLKIHDPNVVDRICTAIKVGATNEQAARCAGVSDRAIRSWLEKACVPGCRKVYSDFAEALSRARDEGIVTLAARIYKASEHDWRAAAHILACRSDDWVKKERRELSGKEGQPVGLQVFLPELEERKR